MPWTVRYSNVRQKINILCDCNVTWSCNKTVNSWLTGGLHMQMYTHTHTHSRIYEDTKLLVVIFQSGCTHCFYFFGLFVFISSRYLSVSPIFPFSTSLLFWLSCPAQFCSFCPSTSLRKQPIATILRATERERDRERPIPFHTFLCLLPSFLTIKNICVSVPADMQEQPHR